MSEVALLAVLVVALVGIVIGLYVGTALITRTAERERHLNNRQQVDLSTELKTLSKLVAVLDQPSRRGKRKKPSKRH